jgi:signal transduction histidine kinase
VLLPPFLILLIVSIVGYVQLSSAVHSSAIDTLKKAAATTSAKLEREFSIRRVVLQNTGSELFAIRKNYQTKRQQLETGRSACRDFLKSNTNFLQAPGDACRPFFAQFAVALKNNTSLAQAVESGYTDQVASLNTLEQTTVSQQLQSFVGVFPEASFIIVTDKNGAIVSQASNTDALYKNLAPTISQIASTALTKPVEGRLVDGRQLVFAYPIDKGAVLAAYNIDYAGFLYPSIKSAPIDTSNTYMIIADQDSKGSYPKLSGDSLYRQVIEAKPGADTSFASSGIDYLAVSEPIGDTNWQVVVGSPKAVALTPLINAQIIAVAIIGFLLVSFLWVGSMFVHRTIGSILGLVGGALIFASGNLSHRIDTARMSDKEFAQLANIMNSMAGRIQEAEKAIDQKNKEFISVATHEIKAPMTAIIGNLSMLLEDGMGTIDQTARTLADQAFKGTIRLRDLVNELLDIARLESGRAKFDLRPVSLKDLTQDMILIQQTPAQEKHITIHYEPNDQLPSVLADKTKLEIILTNFISNGIKYNRSPGTVTITQIQQGDSIHIAVSDTGLGIPQDQQASMFQKFFRVEAADRRGIPGTGLGMYITKQFIEGMGGQLWFESEAGKGTTFHFTLPIAHD